MSKLEPQSGAGRPAEHDPHPSDEEHYGREQHPGGAAPPKGGDRGVADAAHAGKAPPKPRNVETDRQ